MRDKVLAVIETYAAGGTITAALESVGISKTPFYTLIRQDPEVMALYEAAGRVRSYVLLDEAYELGSDKELNPKAARVMSEIRLKIAAMSNPDRFGDRVNVQHEVKPNAALALQEAERRIAPPQRDPAVITDATYTEITNACLDDAADKQSAASEIAPASGDIDPFDV